MQRVFLWILLFIMLLLSGAGSPVLAQSTDPERNDGVVHAVMFWLETCPHCHVVIDQVLPPLQQQYGDQLQIELIEVSSEAHGLLLRQAADTFAVPYDQVGVPFLVIGDHVLVGADQIPTELPGLITQYLANGGVDYPNIPGLAEALPENSSGNASTGPPDTVVPTRASGFGLAIVIMAGMVVALIATAATFIRGTGTHHPQRTQRGSRPRSQRQSTQHAAATAQHAGDSWRERAIPILSLIGLVVAGYLAYVETQSVAAICGPVGDCNAVQSSPYAYLFGIIPIGVLGVVAYVLILVAWLWPRIRPEDALAHYAPLAVFGLTLVGTLFSLYLTYLEPFVIGAVCAWCLTSSVIITLILLASIGPAIQAYNAYKVGKTH